MKETVKRKDGFTLIEMVMIIVLVGIILPVILSPFLQAAKEIATPAQISKLTAMAKGYLEEELEDSRLNFTTTTKGTYSITAATGITPTVTKEFCDYNTGTNNFTCPPSAALSTDYINITVTVADAAGTSVAMQALKVGSY